MAQHNYPVLILGESGTGKELVARSIHFLGPRKNKPFAPVDCSSLVPTLIESELFGYVKGAFTGAQHTKQGLFEAAGEGTLFLDEIGDLPIDLQAKLLRALQEREIKPVGSNERCRIRARVIAATQPRSGIRHSHRSIPPGSVFPAECGADQAAAAARAQDRHSAAGQHVSGEIFRPARPIHTISEDAMRRIMAYDWPGNIRELENAIERAVALGSGPILHVGDLPSNLQYATPERLPDEDELVPLEMLERRAIFRALQESGGDKLAAARLLGIGKTTLYRKLKQYDAQSAVTNSLERGRRVRRVAIPRRGTVPHRNGKFLIYLLSQLTDSKPLKLSTGFVLLVLCLLRGETQ